MTDSLDRLRAALSNRYEVERESGEGGMATVYLARDVRHNRNVALKVLRPELAATVGPDRFLQEVQVTANLQHPHILPLFDSGEADGFLYYVMPYLEGESLRERLAREGELPVGEAVRILKEVTDALAAAHEVGVVHRDVKPDNVMLSGRHAVVTDFGVAKAVSEATSRHKLTTAGVALGTPAYMAPEQATADEHVDHRADVYAVGALGYELLTGHPPFTGRTPQAVLSAQVTETPRPITDLRPAVPPGLGAVLMRCLEKHPADRWQTAEELLTQLEAFATPTGGVTPTWTQPATPAEAKGAGLRRWLVVGVPVAAVAIAAALWLGTRGTPDPAPAATTEEPERLAVVPLDNLTGDAEVDVWGQLAAEWMANAIDRAGPIAVLPAAAVRDAIRALGAEASVSSVGRRLTASHAFAGTLARTGEQIRFNVELLDIRSGERLVALEPIAGPVDSVEAVVGRLADAAATAAVARLDPRGDPWRGGWSLPVRLDAYRDYLRSAELFCQVRYPEAIEAGDQTLAKDPDFVGALLANGAAYANLGRNEEADSVFSQLVPLRDRMTTMERAWHDYWVAYLHGDPSGAGRAIEEAYRIAPTVNGYVAGLEMRQQMRYEEALTRFLAYDPDAPCARDWPFWWTATAGTYHLLGRYDEELALVRRGLERLPGRVELMLGEARVFAATGHLEALDSLLEALITLPSQSSYDVALQYVSVAFELRAHGHRDAAEALSDRALEAISALPPDENRSAQAAAFYHAGRWTDADTLIAALVEEDPESVNYRGARGATLARLGRRAEVLEIDRWLAGVPERPGLRGLNRAWRARIAAILGDRDTAVRHYRDALDHRFLIWVGLYGYSVGVHTDPAFEGIWGYPPWEALLAPR